MNQKSHFLFVCGKNISRSKTAEQIFRQDMRFQARSAWLSPKSPHQISQLDIDRADVIFVMKQTHKKQILQQYDIPSGMIQVMEIDDIYKYMDEELVELLHQWIDDFLTWL